MTLGRSLYICSTSSLWHLLTATIAAENSALISRQHFFRCKILLDHLIRISRPRHPNERISVHGGSHPDEGIFGSFAGSSTAKWIVESWSHHHRRCCRRRSRTRGRPRPSLLWIENGVGLKSNKMMPKLTLNQIKSLSKNASEHR